MKAVSSRLNVPTPGRAVQVERGGTGSTTAAALVAAARLADDQKGALRATLKGSTLPPKAIAADAGLAHTHLLNCANPSAPHHLPFARLPLVLRACDDLTLLRFLAALQGCEVFRLPRAGADGDARQQAVTMREFAELLEAGATAAEDAVITPEEFACIEREAQDVVRTVLEYVAHYRARVQRPLLEGM